jgi:hypothetical protein
MANIILDVDDMDYPFNHTLDSALEGRGSVESCR